MERLARDYLPADLIKATQPHDITGSVAVQARQTIQETEWLLELAANYSCLLYTSPSPRDISGSRMPSSA